MEIAKILLSALAVIISLMSFWFSLKTRAEFRRSVFEDRRDSLILRIEQNDRQGDYLEFRSGLLLDELGLLLEQHPDAASGHIDDLLNGLLILKNNVAQILNSRNYTAENVRCIAFTDENAENFRSLLRGEQALGLKLEQPGWKTMFDHAKKEIKMLRESP